MCSEFRKLSRADVFLNLLFALIFKKSNHHFAYRKVVIYIGQNLRFKLFLQSSSSKKHQ